MAEVDTSATPDPNRKATGRLRRWILRAVATLCVLATATGAWWALGQPGLLWGAGLVVDAEKPAARFALPEPTGPHAVGTTKLHLVDSRRPDPWVEGKSRELMVSVWYPAQDVEGRTVTPYMKPKAAAHFEKNAVGDVGLKPEQVDFKGARTHAFSEAPVDVGRGQRPVVLYSPGVGLPHAVGTVLVEDLASHGYVVVTIDHTYEASVVQFPGRRLKTAKLPEDYDLEKLISVRVSDARFVLDRLEKIRDGGNPDAEGHPLPHGLADALAPLEVGMFGHSAGGFTAAEVMLDDRRIEAGANLDGSMVYSASEGEMGEVTRRGLDRPFMLMGAGTSGEDDKPHTHRASPDWKAFWENSTGGKLDLHIPEGEHFTFTDYQAILPQLEEKQGLPDWILTEMIGTVNPQRSVASQRAYLAAFFDRHLKGEHRELLEGPSPHHPEVDFVR